MAEAPEYEKMWAHQIAEVAGNQAAVRIIELARLNGLFDPNKQVERLRAALKPFALLAEAIECTSDYNYGDDAQWPVEPDTEQHAVVRIGDLRAARDALNEQRTSTAKER